MKNSLCILSTAILLLALASNCLGQIDYELSGSLLSFSVKESFGSCSVTTGSILRVDQSTEAEVHFDGFTVDGSKFEDGMYQVSCEISCTQNMNTGRPTSAGSSSLKTLSAKVALQVVAGTWIAVEEDSVRKRDAVVADDQIVQGSLCVGVDCVNNENFGFDTIRLKENNLRIKFDDTSSSGGFPSTDWQLTANDSANGGLNKFSIEDITSGTTPVTVQGGAPTNSLYVDSAGKVGLGGVPALQLHIVDGNSPALRLEQDGSSGFTPQTWDIAGNEANFFIRDVTGGSKLPFRIRPGAATSAVDILGDSTVELAKGLKLGGSSGVALQEKDGAYYFASDGATLQFNVVTSSVESKNEWRIRFSIQGFTFEQFRTPNNVWAPAYIVCRDSTFIYPDISDRFNLPTESLESFCG